MTTNLKLSEVALQEDVSRYLAGSFSRGRISQAYLLQGGKSVGKTRTAMAAAALILCAEPIESSPTIFDACEVCDSCHRISAQNHPDVIVVKPEGNFIKVDQIRALQEQVSLNPFMGNWIVIIIDPVDRLNENSANCLLKTLEESPTHVVFFLLCENDEKVLPTIKSRAEIVRLRNPTHQQSREAIERSCGVSGDQAARAHGLSGGFFEQSLALAEIESDHGVSFPLRVSYMDYLSAIDEFTRILCASVPSEATLESFSKAAEQWDNTFFPQLSRHRRSFCRSILIQRDIPRSFPIVFSAELVSRIDNLERTLSDCLKTVAKSRANAYQPSIIKAFEDNISWKIDSLSSCQYSEFLDCFNSWFSDIFTYMTTTDERLLLNLDLKEDIITLSCVKSYSFVQNGVEAIGRAIGHLRGHVQPRLVFEHLLTEIGAFGRWS